MPLRNFSLDLSDDIQQAAQRRAQTEGRTLESVLVELLTEYAGGAPAPVLTTYTVKRGDTLARIARQMYGDPHQYEIIQQANNLSDPGRIWVGQVLVIPSLVESEAEPPAPPAPPTPPTQPTPAAPTTPPTPPTPPSPPSPPAPKPEPPQPAAPPRPDPCASIPGESYGALPIVGPPTDRPADQHGDINLALRGYSPTTAVAGLIDMGGPTDHRAPQLAGLFADNRTGQFSQVYRVNTWHWSPPPNPGTRGDPITDFEVTLAGFRVNPAETVHVPGAGYDIGQGYQVLVLYASRERITLKYTGEDTIATGYAIHIEGICTEPDLLALYTRLNGEGRRQLPAVRAGQALGRAINSEIRVAIRDTGRFMDPRVRKDWWRGR